MGKTGKHASEGRSKKSDLLQNQPSRDEEHGSWLEREVSQRAMAWYQVYVLELILRRKPLPPSRDGRHVPLKPVHEKHLVDERTGTVYVSNAIRSSRYTVYDFLPKQIFFQATRLSNFYFICIGVPQTIPGISTTGSFTTILPLLFFMLLTIVKEGYDDYKRHRLDKVENLRKATVLRDASSHQGQLLEKIPWYHSHQRSPKVTIDNVKESEVDAAGNTRWTEIQWRDIRVGDVVKLRRDDPVPADMVLLYADGENGLAYVDTMAMDGETNLKSKQALPMLNHCSTIGGIERSNAHFVLEDPNSNLYCFDGRVTAAEITMPLTLNEVVYRGSILRNTGFVVGMVVNTGEECKIRKNANLHPKAKKPRLEKYSNQIVLTLVVYVILLSAGCSVGYFLWQRSTEQTAFYLENASVDYKDIIIGFAIEFNNVIPLALYVSLEVVKIGQLLMLNRDLELYDEASDTPMKCNTNTILENLGQVNYILSDKTGTLTENVMKLRKLTIAGTAWLHEDTIKDHERTVKVEEREIIGEDLATVETQQTSATTLQDEEIPLPSLLENFAHGPSRLSSSHWRSMSGRDDTKLNGTTADLIEHVRLNPASPFSHRTHEFLLGMALCHTCLPEIKDGKVNFQASSPDEVALLQAAQELGYLVVHRSSQVITLVLKDLHGNEARTSYEILDVVEFSSDRKRMTIIVRRPDGRIWLICKGADSVVSQRLKQTCREGSEAMSVGFNGLNRQSNPCAAVGSGSLDIPQSAMPYSPRVSRMSDCRFDLVDQSTNTDESAIFRRCFEHIHDFATEGLRILLFAHKFIDPDDYAAWKKVYQEAATSLENRQERIEVASDTIEQCLDVLGASAIEDKLQEGVPETINKLRRANIRIWMLTGDKRETAINIAHSTQICRPESDMFILDSSKGNLEIQMQMVSEQIRTDCIHSVAVIDGDTLAVVEGDPELKCLFYSLIPFVDSVICCRASPAQKASIVKAIHARVPGALTLAIGDGANDLAMIQASHVGIGISGKEGLQAARVADFSIAQFRFLQRLILVHGRWNYVRTAKFMLMTFWKEMFFYMMQALYQRYNGYTGTSLYESTSLTVLNTLFTSLCVIIMGVFEQDLSAETLLAIPELYVYGQRNEGLNWPKYLAWTLGATVEGLIVWFMCWGAYGIYDFMGDQGLYAFGDLVFSIGIVWTNWKLFIIETHHKTRLVAFSFMITFAGWWVWNVFLACVVARTPSPYSVRDGFTKTFGKDPIWWLTLILVLTILATVELAYKSVKRVMIRAKVWPSGRQWSSRAAKEQQEEERLRGNARLVGSECDPALWQEMERDPLIRQRLRTLASRDGTATGETTVAEEEAEEAEEAEGESGAKDEKRASKVVSASGNSV